jgi:hypothetical protein
MSNNPATSSQALDNRSSDAPDPLAKLHHMSTTAGLGTTECVAINPMAVASILLGLASALALLDNILLVIPIAGVICSIIALRQIANSNGTQTGKGLTTLGLLLAIGFAGFIGSRTATAAIRTRADRDAIASLVKDFEARIKSSDYDGAYGLFSDRFHKSVPKQTFVDRWTYIRDKAPYGNVDSIAWNGEVVFEYDRAAGVPMAYSIVILKFTKNPEASRQEAQFAKRDDGKWEFENLPNVFPPQTSAQTGAGGAK